MAEVPRFQTSYRRFFRRWKYFDAAFYRERYPDVVEARMQPFAHYLLHGAAEGRKPNRWFDPDYYLAFSAAARARGGDPFLDYLEYGIRHSAATHPLMHGAPPLKARPAMKGALFGCDS